MKSGVLVYGRIGSGMGRECIAFFTCLFVLLVVVGVVVVVVMVA